MKETRSLKLPQRFTAHPKNAEIVRFLHETSPSAHSDVSSEMIQAAQGLRGVHSYSPDPRNYSYEVLHTSDSVIFCVSVGQSALLCRIPPDKMPQGLEPFAKPFPPLGPEWIAVSVFQPEIPLAEWRKSLSKLVKRALSSAV